MKKAFSLIEIMQTVVLLGIIAGLSISFFKKINSDHKLYIATEKQLTSTIREIERKMCSDETPVCQINANDYIRFEDLKYGGLNIPNYDNTGASSPINTPWNCTTVYGAGVTLKDGYCQIHKGSADCPVALTPVYTKDTDGSVSVVSYEPMAKNSEGVCYAPAPCPRPKWNTTDWTAKPINTVTCQNSDKLEYEANIYHYNVNNFSTLEGTTINNYTAGSLKAYPAFCTYFHDAVAHKKQGINDDADIYQTCEKTTIFNTPGGAIREDKILPNNIADILTHNAAKPTINNYNMLLPNGVYLYNLNNGPNDIIIKYDRDIGIGTATYDATDPKSTTIRVYSYAKAQYNNGNGEVVNANDFNIEMLKNLNAQDREKCPDGGLYFGTKTDESGQTVNDCHVLTEDDTAKCKNGGRYVDGNCQEHPSAPDNSQNDGQGTTTNSTQTTTQNDGPSTNTNN